MSKITSSEKFYIEKISEGYKLINKPLTQEKVLILLSSSLKEDESMYKEIKRALDAIYIIDIKNNDGIKEKYTSYAVKLYKGRDTYLRDGVIKWYSSSSMPSIIDSLKGLFR